MLIEYGAGGALYPFLVLFLEEKGLSYPEFTALIFAAASAATFLPFFWGWIADRVLGLNRLVPLLHLASALLLLVIVQTEKALLIAISFVLYSGLRQPLFSLVNALCYHNLRDPPRQFGKLRMWGSAGWMLAAVPIFAWHAITETESFAVAAYLAAGLELLLVATSGFLPDTPPPGRGNGKSDGNEGGTTRAEPHRPSGYLKDLLRLLRTPGLLLLLLMTYLVMCAFSIMFYYSGLRLAEVGIPKSVVGPVLALGVLFEIPLFYLLRGVLDGLGYRWTLFLGCLASLVRQLVFALSSSPLLLVAASTLVAPSVVYFLIASSLAANSLAAREVRATVQSLLTLVGAGLGTMTGLLVSYFLNEGQETPSMELPFLFAAGTSALGLLLAPFFHPSEGSPGLLSRAGPSRP